MTLLGLLSRNITRADETNLTLIFPDDADNVCITQVGTQSTVHIKAPKAHAKLDSELYIQDLPQFVKYCKAIGYPKKPDTALSTGINTSSTRKRKYETITYKGNGSTFNTMVASPTEFSPEYDRKIPTSPDKDPLRLAAKIAFTEENIKRISDARNLMGSDAKNFCIAVDDGEISLYMRGLLGQQAKIEFNSLDYMIYGDFDTKTNDTSAFKLFTLEFIDSLSVFKTQFNCEIRVYEVGEMQTIVLKAFAEYGADNEEKIQLIVAAQESEAAVMANVFDIIT
jgi:hypothetical protein